MSYSTGVSQKRGSEVSPYCDYLLSQAGGDLYNPTIFSGTPFKIFTKSLSQEITDGTPVQVTIGPFSKTLNFFNFTDFILYATPVTAPVDSQYLARNTKTLVGVFQLFDKWRAGAGGLTCSPNSRADDSVAAFEDRLMATYQRFYPSNYFLQTYHLPARNQVAVLWWPTKETMKYPEIKFVANIKSMGNWYKLQSNPWKVKQPVDQWAATENMMNQFKRFESKVSSIF
ncbi:hypothetical protein BsWGS_26944 [Bradybaena similaris]